MSDVWERSLALIGEQGALPVFARVHQGGKDLPLHQAVRALEPILFTAGVAEFIFCYSEFKLNGAAGPTYSQTSFGSSKPTSSMSCAVAS
jgi:hypothetical protein